METQYIQTFGSFIRNGKYPLEADYIFANLDDLRWWEETNRKYLHEGLLKIVKESDKQSLYWAVEKDGEFQFEKLIDDLTLTSLNETIENLKNEISNREDADSDLQELLETLELILIDVEDQTDHNTEAIKAIVGTEEDDIVKYLKTLDFQNLTVISATLNKFLNTVDNIDEKINTLPELQKFLTGYSESDTLLKVLEDLKETIVGNTNKYNTLEEIESALLLLTQVTKNRFDNLQTELDQTQVGVGLSGDGAYNADKETYYLQDATSVMNALKTLDRLIHRIDYQVADTDTVEFVATLNEVTNSATFTANVKISNDSDILVKEDGLYTKLETEYENGILTLKVNGEVRGEHNIGLDALVEDSYYDTKTETIVILFKLHNDETQRVEIPAENLITEWETINTNSVTLTKTRVVDGPDTLQADLKVSTKTNQAIKVDSTGTFVSNHAKDMTSSLGNLDEVIQEINSKVDGTIVVTTEEEFSQLENKNSNTLYIVK